MASASEGTATRMIQVQSTIPKEALEEGVDQEIQEFDAWFQSLGNSPLVKGERAIIKTYLAWKLKVSDGEKSTDGH